LPSGESEEARLFGHQAGKGSEKERGGMHQALSEKVERRWRGVLKSLSCKATYQKKRKKKKTTVGGGDRSCKGVEGGALPSGITTTRDLSEGRRSAYPDDEIRGDLRKKPYTQRKPRNVSSAPSPIETKPAQHLLRFQVFI